MNAKMFGDGVLGHALSQELTHYGGVQHVIPASVMAGCNAAATKISAHSALRQVEAIGNLPHHQPLVSKC